MTHNDCDISIDALRQHFDYDAETGIVRRKIAIRGRPAGSKVWANGSAGYPKVQFEGRTVMLHRLIWALTYNAYPPAGMFIDHKNGDRRDNRLCNLRLASNSQNQANKVKWSGTSSRYKGVSWEKSRRLWKARIKKDGILINIGRYATEEEAHAAYCRKADELFGEYARYA